MRDEILGILACKIRNMMVISISKKSRSGAKYISEFRFRILETRNIGSQQVVKNQNGDYFSYEGNALERSE